VKLALNIFAARIFIEAARGAIRWALTEVFNLGTGRPSRRPPAMAVSHPRSSAAAFAHANSAYP
jgi:hypothetical protein